MKAEKQTVCTNHKKPSEATRSLLNRTQLYVMTVGDSHDVCRYVYGTTQMGFMI